MDSQLDSANFNRNFGASTTIVLKGAASESRNILQFDTSIIPPGTVIVSATLRMSVTVTTGLTANPKVINAYAVTQAWVEGTKTGNPPADGATWNKSDGTNWTTTGGTYRLPLESGATDEATTTSPPAAGFTTGWLTWNLTALAQEWVDGVTANNGAILVSTVADSMTIASRENVTAANRPQLVISYY
jgi:hypothetical protein